MNTTSLIESFSLYSSNQYMIPSYLMSFTELRNQMIDWLHFLCNNLHFRQETLYRSISIFDIYISKAYTNENLFDIENVKLIAIASLSLSTKIEEINCNFLNFFSEQVLQNETTPKMLAKKELSILKKLNFKTNQSTCYQFLTVFQELFSNLFGKANSQINNYFCNLSEQYLIIAIKSDVFLSQKDLALIAVNQALMQINTCDNSLSIVVFNFMQHLQNIINYNNKSFKFIYQQPAINSNTVNPILSL